MWFSFSVYTLLLLLTYYSVGSKNFLKKVGFKKIRFVQDSAHALCLAFAMVLVSIAISISFVYIGMGEDTAKVTQTIMSAQLWQVLIILIIGPIIEEIFFRGYLQKKTNLITASAAFSYFHVLYGSVSELAGAFILGLMLGKAFEKTKNLYIPVLSHYLYNFTVLAIALAAQAS